MDKQFLPVDAKKDTQITHKRQIERGVISKAIYMVTDLFKEGEPLKMALRNLAVLILQSDNIEDVAKLKNLLTLSAEVGIVSEANVSILLKAIDSMKSLTREERATVELQALFEDSVTDEPSAGAYVGDSTEFDINNTVNVVSSEVSQAIKSVDKSSKSPTSVDVLNKGQAPETSALFTSVVRTNAATLREQIQKQMSDKQPVSTVTTLDIGTRRKKILEVVKSKGQVTIHEFIQSIQGCSSKTIQRELTSLVLSGTLKKTGERRWSKYSLR